MDPKLAIHITTVEEDGWILRKISDAFAAHLPSTTVSKSPDPKADVNFYVNYPLYEGPTKCDIGFFTHRDRQPPESETFDRIAVEVDWCIAMCRQTADLLPPEKTSIITVGVDPQFHKEEIILGIVGREYASKRKRFHWIPKLNEIPGIRILVTEGRYPFEAMPEFYNSIDYLMVLSDNEGGPIPVLEALAMGKPIIAPDVGFAWEYPCLRYSSFEELQEILQKLVYPKDRWQTASAALLSVFHEVVRRKKEV